MRTLFTKKWTPYRVVRWSLLVVFLIGLGLTCVGHTTYTGKVLGKDSGRQGKYDITEVYITTDNGGKMTLANNNNIVIGKQNSETLQSDLQVGKTYRFDTVGVLNIGMMFRPNILTAKQVSD